MLILVVGCAPPADEPLFTSMAAAPESRAVPPPAAAAEEPDSPASALLQQRGLRPAGEQQLGNASYYGPEFTGRKMANGRPFDPRSATVAHRTLPFGTRVLVTHLGNGRSAMATVEDRGPFIRGRIIDLSPRLAERLGMTLQGVAAVEVTPVETAPVEIAEAPG
ncbi:septal ring lytic transglycosylase RlpA family protein [Muricoccus vinaceus]|uniref:Endolytic peptidoglycan transglycosylase RlpA n=1 Tax=Muricoccus vinaceus TaxID=424704 RepID=A0ABV6IRI1_9PROT